MGKVIQINNNYKLKQMEDLRIKTADEMQNENQEDKSQLVEAINIEGLSEAFKIMRYENKYFIGFMGAMMTEPTENLNILVAQAKQFSNETWALLLNIVTHIVKNRKLIDNLKSETNE
jgi:hypothetical protein